MNREDFRRIEELFHEAVELPPGPEREYFLEHSCKGENALLDQLRRLITVDEEEAVVSTSSPSAAAAVLPRLGVFQAERVLGRGGMGTVYLARRTDGQYEQRVAVKTLSQEFTDERIRQAFLNERQILASLTHPGIARILDGGMLPNGIPYQVMEYVDGVPLDAYSREHKQSLRERIVLLEGLCDAVSFAHRNLIVHLDLKPSNILVAAGQVKVLDFGTAKVLSGPDASVTQRIVTPRYASPEQLRGERAGVAADIFSIGIIMAELLSGVWPFGNPDSGMDRMRRAVETIRPSSLTQRATDEHASQCGLSLVQLRRKLNGDLESIVLKAIESDPAARYRSVDELAADLRAFVEGRPVRARRAGHWYVARKFVQRHKSAVALSSVALAALATAGAAALWEWRVAQQSYDCLRDLTTSMLFGLKDAIRDMPGSTDAQRLLVSRVLKDLDQMQTFSADPTLRFNVAECYRQLGELQGDPYVPNLGDAKSGLQSLSRAEQLASTELRRTPRDASWLWVAGFIQQNIGEVYFGQNNPQAAAERLRRSIDYFDRMAAITTDPSHFSDAAAAHAVLGDILGSPNLASLFDRAGAEAEYTRCIQMDEEGLRRWPGYVRLQRGLPLIRSKRSDLLQATNPRRALEDIETSLREIDQLPKAETERPATQRTRIMIQIKHAEALARLHNWVAARAAMEEPLAFYRDRAAADPRDDRARVDLASTTGKLLEIAYQQPGSPDALSWADRVIPMWEERIRNESEVLIYRAELAAAEAHRAVLLMRGGRTLQARAQGMRARRHLEAVLRDPKAGRYESQRCSAALADLAQIR